MWKQKANECVSRLRTNRSFAPCCNLLRPPKPQQLLLLPSAVAEELRLAGRRWQTVVDRGYTNRLTVCLCCSENRPLNVGPRSKAQKQTLVMFESCNCSSRVMFLFSPRPRWTNSRSHLTSRLGLPEPRGRIRQRTVGKDRVGSTRCCGCRPLLNIYKTTHIWWVISP